MKENLMQSKNLFSPMRHMVESSQNELTLKLPNELRRRTVSVESVYRVRRIVTAQYNNSVTSTTTDESYTKRMINIVFDGDKYTFEYKESLFPRGIGKSELAPFIAKGDKITACA